MLCVSQRASGVIMWRPWTLLCTTIDFENSVPQAPTPPPFTGSEIEYKSCQCYSTNRDKDWIDQNIKGETDASDINHHNSECQEGVEGGLRIRRNNKPRWRENETEGVVIAIWFWLWQVGADSRLRNIMAFIKIKREFNMERV